MIDKIPAAKIRYSKCSNCSHLNNPEGASDGYPTGYSWGTMLMYCTQCCAMHPMTVENITRATITDSEWEIDTTTMVTLYHWEGRPYSPRNLYAVKAKSDSETHYMQPKELAEIFAHVISRGGTAKLFDATGNAHDLSNMKSDNVAIVTDKAGKPRTFNVSKLASKNINRVELSGADFTMTEILNGISGLCMKAVR